jgi:hypothetical protein
MTSAISAEGAPSIATFVGRERELAELRGGLDDVSAGHGRLFLLSGEPGIGKTRLAEEISNEAAAREMRVVWGRCWEGGGAPAYWPFIQVLRACLAAPTSSIESELSFTTALRILRVSARSPLVLAETNDAPCGALALRSPSAKRQTCLPPCLRW